MSNIMTKIYQINSHSPEAAEYIYINSDIQ